MDAALANAVQTLFDTSSLTSTLTQVVQFSFTNGTTTFNSNAVDYWGVSLEYTLNTFAVGNLTNSECRVQTAVTDSDNHALECLQTFFATFNDPYLHFHGITRTECRYVLFHLLLFKLLNNVAHNMSLTLGKLIYRSRLMSDVSFIVLLPGLMFPLELSQQHRLLVSQS